MSFYTRHGDWFAWLMSAFSIIAGVFLLAANVIERQRNYSAIHGNAKNEKQ